MGGSEWRWAAVGGSGGSEWQWAAVGASWKLNKRLKVNKKATEPCQ